MTEPSAMPIMFFVPEEWEVQHCPLEPADQYGGFWVEIMVSQRTFERSDFLKLRASRNLGDGIRALEMAARWCRDWNVYEKGEDGQPVKVTPPIEGGVESFMRTNPKITGWILDEIQAAFLGGKGLSGSPKRSETRPEPGTEQSAAEPPATKPSSRRSRKNSSSPAPSTTAA